MAFPWTDEQVEFLKKLWADGLSNSQIAAEMNREFNAAVTRSAVIGKVHRLELPERPKKPSSCRPRAPRASPGRRVRAPIDFQVVGNLALEAQADEQDTIDNVVPLVIPMEQRRTLLELTKAICRWPVGDPGSPEFFFCGSPALEGRPYCNYHCCIAYQPLRGRV